MRRVTPFAAAALVVLASCGGGSDADDAPTTTSADSTESPTTADADITPATEPAVTEPATTPAPTTEPPPTLPEAAPWDAPTFDEAIEPTMAALEAGVGQEVSAAAVAPEVVLPDGVPTPGGVVTGTGWVSEYDTRFNEYDLAYSVGIESTITSTELQVWQDSVGNGWRAPSFAESGSLFTSLLVDEQDQRLVHLLDIDAAANGNPVLNLEWSPTVTTLLEPEWLASLPMPEGGVLTEISAARGLVSVGLGGSGFDGSVLVRADYELADYDRLVEYFEAGILIGAGFTYEPEPLSNSRYRRDVAIGDWSGDVRIGDASADDVEYLQVLWRLTRGAD